MNSDRLKLTNLRFVVLDEADSMFDLVRSEGCTRIALDLYPAPLSALVYCIALKRTSPHCLHCAHSLTRIFILMTLWNQKGFQDDMENILGPVCTNRGKESELQVLLFSATMPYEIEDAVRKYTRADSLKRLDTVGASINKTSTTVTHCALKCPWYVNRMHTVTYAVLMVLHCTMLHCMFLQHRCFTAPCVMLPMLTAAHLRLLNVASWVGTS